MLLSFLLFLFFLHSACSLHRAYSGLLFSFNFAVVAMVANFPKGNKRRTKKNYCGKKRQQKKRWEGYIYGGRGGGEKELVGGRVTSGEI